MSFKFRGFSKTVQTSTLDSLSSRFQSAQKERKKPVSPLQNLYNVMAEAHRASGVSKLVFPGYGKFEFAIRSDSGANVVEAVWRPDKITADFLVNALWSIQHVKLDLLPEDARNPDDYKYRVALVARVEISTESGHAHFHLTGPGSEPITYSRLEDVKAALVSRLQHSYGGLVFHEQDSGMVWVHPLPVTVAREPAASGA